MRQRLVLLLLLVLLRPALAGSASDVRALQDAGNLDRFLDQDVSALTEDLRDKRVTASQVVERGKFLLRMAQEQVRRVKSLGSHAVVLSMVSLQAQRIEAIVHAAEVESGQGLATAKPLWERELAVMKQYRAAMQQAEKASFQAGGSQPLAAGTAYQCFRVHAGGLSEVQLRAYYLGTPSEEQRFGQIVAVGANRTPLWSGPRAHKSEQGFSDPLVFCDGPAGSGDLQAVGPWEGAALEAIGVYPQSDVRATHFRILRWSDKRFTVVHDGVLLLSDANHFAWKKAPADKGTWIGHFRALLDDGTAVVAVGSGSSPYKWGTACVRPDGKGFTVVQWVTSLRPPKT